MTATVLTDAFKRDGWTVIDPSFAAGKVRVSSAVALGATEAKEIGTLSKADYILYGTVAFRDVPPDGVLVQQDGQRSAFPLTGDYDLGVFETSAGAQLAKVSGKLRSEMKDVSVNSREESAYNLVRGQRGGDHRSGPQGGPRVAPGLGAERRRASWWRSRTRATSRPSRPSASS